MDYYQPSSAPELDPQNLSGGVAFHFNGAIASASVGGNRSFISGASAKKTMQVVTIQVCVDGESKSLDVYAVGQPY
jgi:hypothetical protein